MTNEREASIREAYPIPAYIQACASAIRYDLLHGPAFAAIGPGGVEAFTADDFATFAEDLADMEGYTVTEVFGGIVEDTLRDFIDALPRTLYAEPDGYLIGESEPEGEWLNSAFEPCDSEDEDATWQEADYYILPAKEIVAALFGQTIAKEF